MFEKRDILIFEIFKKYLILQSFASIGHVDLLCAVDTVDRLYTKLFRSLIMTSLDYCIGSIMQHAALL